MLEPTVKSCIEMLVHTLSVNPAEAAHQMRVLKRTVNESLNRQRHGLAMARLIEELDRTGCKASEIGISRRKIMDGEQLPSFADMELLLGVGIDVPYVLSGNRLCDMEKLVGQSCFREGIPEPDEFTRTFLSYGGGTFERIGEPQRLAFCNWLLVECLAEYPRRDLFIKAFSTGGDLAFRRREAGALSGYSKISMGDLADAIFQSCTDPEALVNYAGKDGCK